MKEKQEENQEPSAPFWMVTYSDMVTLLLTFFILLLSFAELDEIKFEEAAHSLKGALGVLAGQQSPRRNKTNNDSFSEVDMLRRRELYSSVAELQKVAEELGYENDISINIHDNGILIRMGDRVLFDLGKANLKEKAFPILDVVGKTIRNKATEVLVGGHTDNYPIDTVEFPSNWELSTTRAIKVVKYLIENAGVSPTILAPIGYSEFKPIGPNDTKESRQKNRRVEFLVTWK